VVSGFVKKGEYSVGENAIYCEIDSYLPVREEFEFLRKSSYKKMGDQEGFRLKTIKLRGQISQGLLLPISILKDKIYPDQYKNLQVGDEVSEALGVWKYEPPIPAELSGVMKGSFPSFLQKTDEERIQNLADVFENFKKSMFYVTEKLDGSSATYYIIAAIIILISILIYFWLQTICISFLLPAVRMSSSFVSAT